MFLKEDSSGQFPKFKKMGKTQNIPHFYTHNLILKVQQKV